MLKHDTAALLGEPQIELERALAKHLLDCSLLFLLKCTHMIIPLQPWKLMHFAGQRVPDRPRIPGLEQILNETIAFSKPHQSRLAHMMMQRLSLCSAPASKPHSKHRHRPVS